MRLDRFVIFVVLCGFAANSEDLYSDGAMFDEVFECLDRNTSLSCIASSAARSIERATNATLPISKGVSLARNEEPIPTRQAKSLNGFERLGDALSNFIDTHSFSIDLTEPPDIDEETSRAGGKAGGGGTGGGGGGFFNKKALRREKKYYQYAFMVLLGIFGLTGPLVMKILGIMAAQSLLASKAALIIVGSVALKKIFETGGSSKPKVTVTTLPVQHDKYDSEEELDRLSYGYNRIPHGYGHHGYGGRNSPYYGFYNNERSEFAPVLDGKPEQSIANS